MRAFVLVAVMATLSVPVAAQEASSISFGFSPHVSTLGVGADVGIGLHPRVSVRAGANFIPWEPSITVSDTKWVLSFPKTQFTGMVDLFLVGGLRLTGGIRYKTSDVEATGEYLGTVSIGDSTYTGDQVGNLVGAIVTKDLAPYAGFGFGNVAKRGLGFILDLGVAFHGSPGVTLTADGPISNDPTFQAELDKEVANVEDDISWAKVYPVLTIGLSYGF
jgi:hypothetical protein